MCYLVSFIFVIVCGLFYWGSESMQVVHHLIISVLSMKIQLSRAECWNIINLFNPVSFLWMSYSRTKLLTPYVNVFFAFDGLILLSWPGQYWSRNCPHFRSTWVHPTSRFHLGSCCSILSLFAFFALAIVLSVLLKFTLLGYPLVISNFSLRWEAIVIMLILVEFLTKTIETFHS